MVSLEDQVIELLKDHMVALGYPGIKRENRKTKNGIVVPFCLQFQNEDPEKAMVHKPSCTAYAGDLYPNDRGEAFFTVWNWIGFSSKGEAKRIADYLTRKGIPSRATTHQKNHVVRFKFDPKWS